MRKKLLIFILLLILSTITVYANNSFKLDIKRMFNENYKIKNLQENFNSDYILTTEENNIEDADIIREKTKMATYYLLGPANSYNEISESYINRKNMLYKMRYAPVIPKNADGTLDKTSQEYKDDMYTGFKIPGMFLLLQEYDIVYKNFGTIQIAKSDDNLMISMITLLNVEMKIGNADNPMEFDTIKTNLTIRYIFKKIDGDYKIYYIEAEYDDSDLEKYFNEQENNEYNGIMSANIVYKPDISSLYDYSKLEKLSSDTISKIYNNNLNNIIILNTLYNNSIEHTATGFIINNGIAVTTWSYLDKSLRDGQSITIKDGNGKSLIFEGIISIDTINDLAVLKISGSDSKGVKIGDTTKLELNDPVIAISTKTGVNLSLQKGIVISTIPNIISIIPVRVEEEGGPLFNQNGEVIGINTSKLVNVSTSSANSTISIKAAQEKFNKLKTDNIEYKTFKELKENYYTKYNNDIVINNISNKVWKKYKSIGNIENTISLELVKASYKNKIISLRYKNNLNSIIPNMQFANNFINTLRKDGYNEIIDTEYKKIYTNNKHRITIMSEFNYLIIVMTEI